MAVIFPDFEELRRTGETDVHSRVKWYLDLYSQQLEPYKRIRDFVLTNQELPKTRLGKVRMQEAAKIYQARAGKLFEAKKSALEENLSETGVALIHLLQEKIGDRVIALDDHLELDLGLDSLALVELAAALEERFGLVIKEDGFADILSVAELIKFVDRQGPRGQEITLLKQRSWAEILRQEPPPELQERIELGHPWWAAFNAGSSGFLVCWREVFFGLTSQGREHLTPARCPPLLQPRQLHRWFPDLPGNAFGLPSRFVFYGHHYLLQSAPGPLAGEGHAGHPHRFGPPSHSRHAGLGLRAAARQNPVRFPEGSRSITGELLPIRKGAVILAKELDVPIMPAYIQGAHEAWGPSRAFPRPHPVKIIFGPEQSYAELVAAGRRLKPEAPDDDAATLGLREAI